MEELNHGMEIFILGMEFQNPDVEISNPAMEIVDYFMENSIPSMLFSNRIEEKIIPCFIPNNFYFCTLINYVMKTIKQMLLSVLLFAATMAFGQGQINLMNGKIIKMDSVVGKVDNEVIYLPVGEKKAKTIAFHKIYSINHSNGSEEVFYIYDSLNNGDMTVPHMKSYILGRQNARENYHAPSSSLGGVIIGGASAVFGIVYGPVPLAMYCLVASLHYPNVAHQEFSDKAMLDDPYYLYGYQIYAKRKKMRNAFVIGGISFGISFAVLVNNRKTLDGRINKFFGIK